MAPATLDVDVQQEFRLHTYYRSSCSARLRIALNLKGISAEYVYILLYDDQQLTKEYQEINPSASVPVLTHLVGDGPSFPIAQSVAALEYLEEVYPDQYPLLPPRSQPLQRAKVRTLVNVISNDVQPITNRRMIKAVTEFGADGVQWSKKFMTRGLQAYETYVAKFAGKYSVGDNITLADVLLLPAIYGAEKNEVELETFPTIMRIYHELSELDAVKRAHWSVQQDTPEDLSWI